MSAAPARSSSTPRSRAPRRPRRGLALAAGTAAAALLLSGLPAIAAQAAPVDLARFGTVTA